ncbi:MAG: DoxX family protein [Ferruginibacter sp.]
MKKLLSIKYAPGAFSVAILILRLGAGILMMHHGYDKLVHFDSLSNNPQFRFLGLSSSLSLSLDIFAEFFCALFVVLGLFTRLATIPIIIAMGTALFQAHNGDIFGKGELSTLYLTAFIVLLLVGPGRVSVDGMVGK